MYRIIISNPPYYLLVDEKRVKSWDDATMAYQYEDGPDPKTYEPKMIGIWLKFNPFYKLASPEETKRKFTLKGGKLIEVK